jgi:predicted nucleotidyltransferase
MAGSLTEAQIDAIVRLVGSAYPEVEGVYLYGSAAGGTLGRHSDVDIAALLPPGSARAAGSLALSDVRFRLEEALERPVDLVNARVGPIVLQKEIVAGGILVFAGDRSKIDEYEMIVLSLYGELNEERRGILEEFAATRKAYRV